MQANRTTVAPGKVSERVIGTVRICRATGR